MSKFDDDVDYALSRVGARKHGKCECSGCVLALAVISLREEIAQTVRERNRAESELSRVNKEAA